MLDPQRPVLVEGGDARFWGTKFGLDGSVVAITKSTIACLAAPSFHEGSVSVADGASASVQEGKKRRGQDCKRSE